MKKTKVVLVTGGAGYLGRIACEVLLETGYHPIILDNFSRSKRHFAKGIDCHQVDLCQFERLNTVIKKYKGAAGVLHFAAYALVNESTQNPHLYFFNNIQATSNLAEAMCQNGIKNLIHSSSCAVYGVPNSFPIKETDPLSPVSPYGESKKIAEQILKHFSTYKKLRVLNLRYFNPVGSYKGFGEEHEPETHFFPNLIEAFLKNKTVKIFGNRYPTPDGTCIRDFIHVHDLLSAHIHALRYLGKQPAGYFDCLNIGTGKGTSLTSVISELTQVTGKTVKLKMEGPRTGDPPQLFADTSKSQKLLGFRCQHSLSSMLKSQLEFARTKRGKKDLE